MLRTSPTYIFDSISSVHLMVLSLLMSTLTPACLQSTNDESADASVIHAIDAGRNDAIVNDEFLFQIIIGQNLTPGSDEHGSYAAVENWADITGEHEQETLRVGSCAYTVPALAPLCEPECPVGKVCNSDAECQVVPGNVNAGPIEVNGLQVGLLLEAHPPQMYYQAVFDPAEPADGMLFSNDAVITATADGADIDGFTLQSHAVQDVITDLSCDLGLQSGQDLLLHWTPIVDAKPLQFTLQSINHAGQMSRIVCSMADTGELRVDARLVDRFLADFHVGQSWSISRTSSDTQVLGAVTVRLSVTSRTGCFFYD